MFTTFKNQLDKKTAQLETSKSKFYTLIREPEKVMQRKIYHNEKSRNKEIDKDGNCLCAYEHRLAH